MYRFLLCLVVGLTTSAPASAAEPTRPPERGGIFIPFKRGGGPPAETTKRETEAEAAADAAGAEATEAAAPPPGAAADIQDEVAAALHTLLRLRRLNGDPRLDGAIAALFEQLPQHTLTRDAPLHERPDGAVSGRLAAGSPFVRLQRAGAWQAVHVRNGDGSPAGALGWLRRDDRGVDGNSDHD